MISDAWKSAGPSAADMFLINKIEDIAQVVVDGVKRIELGPIHLIDSGDGKTLPQLASAYPAAVAQVLKTLVETTGVDITKTLTQAAGHVGTSTVAEGGPQ